MKPSFTNGKSQPSTDRKFQPKDEHLLAQNKDEVHKVNHGDKMEALTRHEKDNHPEEEKNTQSPE